MVSMDALNQIISPTGFETPWLTKGKSYRFSTLWNKKGKADAKHRPFWGQSIQVFLGHMGGPEIAELLVIDEAGDRRFFPTKRA